MTSPNPPESNDDKPQPWSRRRQEVGAIVWSSFLAACLATMIFFAFFDPLTLGADDYPPAWLPSRMAGYALGFFFFWLVTFVAALLAAYLLETLPADLSDTGGNTSERIAHKKNIAGDSSNTQSGSKS
jgi:hypothetical protein